MTAKKIIVMKASEKTEILNGNFYFEVPEGTKSIQFKVTKTIDMYFTMGVYDSKGRLRAQFLHGGQDGFVIHQEATKSSPYTISGEIPTGEWYCSVIGEGDEFDVDQEWGKIHIQWNPKEVNEYEFTTWIDTETYPYLSGFDRNKVYNDQARWYKGDLHTHTHFSDGEMSPEEIMQSALDNELDFFVNTDHSIMTTSWPEKDELLVIPGVEISFYHGHSNIINPEKLAYQNGDIRAIASQEGAVSVFNTDFGEHSLKTINHPVLGQHTWQYGKTPLDKIDAIEIINGPNYSESIANDWAILSWDYLLNEGYKITGVGGSDIHSAPGNKYNAMIGDPANYIFSEKLTANHLTSNIKKGHVIVSRIGLIDIKFYDYLPGDTVSDYAGEISLSFEADEPITVEWVLDGQTVQVDHHTDAIFKFELNQDYHWLRVNFRNQDGLLMGFTNPYYFGEKKPVQKDWQSVIEHINALVPETRDFYFEDY